MQKKFHSSSGATVVEAAVVLPVLCLLVFGMIQWGMILSADITLRSACSSGLRESLRSGSTDTTIVQEATKAISASLSTSNLTASISNVTVNGSPARRLSMSYQYPVSMSWVVPGTSNGRYTLQANAIFR